MIINIVFPHDIPPEKNRGIYQRIKTLSKFKVRLLTLNRSLVAEEIKENIKLYRMPPVPSFFEPIEKYIEKVLFGPWAFIQLLWLEVHKASKIIYTPHHFDYLLGFLFSKLTGTKWVIDAFHTPYYHLDYGKERENFLLRLRGLRTIWVAKTILRYVDLAFVMAHSKRVGFSRILIDDFNVPPDRLVPIPDGVDISLVNPNRFKNLESERDEFNVFYVGSITNSKTHDLLLAAKRFGKTKYPFHFTLVGPVNRAFKKQFENLLSQSEASIECTGKLPHNKALELMSKADLCVNTLSPFIRDYRYAHPGKILEYLAMGKAVISTDLPGINGMIKDGYNGLLYPAGNIDALANAIRKLYNYKILKEQLEGNARKSVIKFDWDNLNRKIIEALKAL